MPAHARSPITAALAVPAPHTTPAAPAFPALPAVRVPPAVPVPYDGPRAAVADFFTLARAGRAQTAPPPLRNGDSVSCPWGTEWMRYDGRWIVPGQPKGKSLADRAVTAWWQTRTIPGSEFALVHRLTSHETQDLITGEGYISSYLTGDTFSGEPVSGTWLRWLAWQAARTRTVSVHLELPSGIVTLHSSEGGDVFFHPAPANDPKALSS